MKLLHTVRRYGRLYLYFLRFSFSKALEFRVDFWFRFVMDLLFYGLQLAFFEILYRHIPSIGGWGADEAFLFIAGFFVVDAMQMTIISSNMHQLSRLVNDGSLDYYLVRPVSSLFFLSFREFAANSFMNLVVAISIVGWALWRYPTPLNPWLLSAFGLALLLGFLIYYALRMLLLLPTFWTNTGRGLDLLFHQTTVLMERPDTIYRGMLRVLFVSVLPYALIASFPARIIIDGTAWGILLHLALVAGIFLVLLRWAWRRALANYSSASS